MGSLIQPFQEHHFCGVESFDLEEIHMFFLVDIKLQIPIVSRLIEPINDLKISSQTDASWRYTLVKGHPAKKEALIQKAKVMKALERL